MPHIKLEISKNLEKTCYNDILQSIQMTLNQCADVPQQNCKCRVYIASHFIVGDSQTPDFIHLEIAMLEGRSPQAKSEIGEKALKILENAFPQNGVQITIEIRDILATQYFKKAKPC